MIKVWVPAFLTRSPVKLQHALYKRIHDGRCVNVVRVGCCNGNCLGKRAHCPNHIRQEKNTLRGLLGVGCL